MMLRGIASRMTGSLQSRFMFSVGLLLALLMGSIILAVDNRLASLLLRENHATGAAVARSIGATTTSALVTYDYLSLTQSADEAVREGGIAYVIILDKENAVAAHRERSDFRNLEFPEAVVERAEQATSPVLQTVTLGNGSARKRVLDVACPVYPHKSGVKWGTIRVGLDLAPMHAEIRRIRLILFAIGFGAAALALLGARIISRRITRSIDDLVHGTIAVSRGDLNHRIVIDSEDEIATLAEHFNHMTEQVKKHQTEIAVAKGELEILTATLEEQISKRTQEFLASEEKYRILVDNSPDPILIDQADGIRFVNPAFARVFGYGHEGMVRQELRTEEIFHPDDRSRIREMIDRILRNEPVEASEVRGLTRDGAVRTFEMRGMRIYYLDEPAVEIILTDVTMKRELQDHLLQHEKLRALGELASGVAHDFNNILGIILGRAQLLQRYVKDPDVLLGLRTIERAAEDGGETVRRIQDFARARTEMNFTDVDLVEVLEEVVEITRTRWRDQAEIRGVRIDVDLRLEPIGIIRGNGSELREVYTNLIFNAVDAMPEGGRIEISCRREGEEAVVLVRDDGQGMDDQVKARIFDPFFTTKGTKGMGLGMSVVYGIIDRHGGAITVESEPNQGTCFTLRFPAHKKDSIRDQAEVEITPDRSARVLVIDDQEEILDLVSDILGSHGHQVRTESSGPAGLAALREQEFDLLFCDLGMREMSGWEVVSTVRRFDALIGVVLLTGWGATLSPEKVSEYGIDAVLGKPFPMSRIVKTLHEVLGMREARMPT
jgi:PAS domain S-box-containing protein